MKWTFPLIVLMLAVLPLELAGAQGPSTTRRAMATGGPIVAQLRPTDRVVTLEINEHRPLTAIPPNGESRVNFIARQSDAIVIARLVRKTPQFVQRKFLQNTPAAVAQANWITSLVEARVERVIKESRDLALGAGTPLVFEEDSAVATIGDTRVETRIGDCTGAPATILLTCAHVWA